MQQWSVWIDLPNDRVKSYIHSNPYLQEFHEPRPITTKQLNHEGFFISKSIRSGCFWLNADLHQQQSSWLSTHMLSHAERLLRRQHWPKNLDGSEPLLPSFDESRLNCWLQCLSVHIVLKFAWFWNFFIDSYHSRESEMPRKVSYQAHWADKQDHIVQR